MRIAHILILTTSVALMAAWWEWCNRLQYFNTPQSPPESDAASRMTWALAQGSLLAALLFLAANFRSTGRLLYHPGHWILLLNSLPVPVFIVVHTLRSLQFRIYGDSASNWLAFAYPDLIFALAYAAIAVAWIFAIIWRREGITIVWKVVFFLFVCIWMLYAVHYAAFTLGSFSPISPGVLWLQAATVGVILVAGLADWIAQIRRDWLHWYAVLIIILAFVVDTASELAMARS